MNFLIYQNVSDCVDGLSFRFSNDVKHGYMCHCMVVRADNYNLKHKLLV